MKDIKQLEKEIIKALKINAKYDWNFGDPNKEFKDLIPFTKELFKKYESKRS